MQDTELYQYILGLQSPWKVSNVDLNMELGEIVVRVSHPKGTRFCCPQCSKELGCYDRVLVTTRTSTYFLPTSARPNQYMNRNPDYEGLRRTGKQMLDLYYIMLVPAFIGSVCTLHFVRASFKRYFTAGVAG